MHTAAHGVSEQRQLAVGPARRPLCKIPEFQRRTQFFRFKPRPGGRTKRERMVSTGGLPELAGDPITGKTVICLKYPIGHRRGAGQHRVYCTKTSESAENVGGVLALDTV